MRLSVKIAWVGNKYNDQTVCGDVVGFSCGESLSFVGVLSTTIDQRILIPGRCTKNLTILWEGKFYALRDVYIDYMESTGNPTTGTLYSSFLIRHQPDTEITDLSHLVTKQERDPNMASIFPIQEKISMHKPFPYDVVVVVHPTEQEAADGATSKIEFNSTILAMEPKFAERIAIAQLISDGFDRKAIEQSRVSFYVRPFCG